jgi:hypothetical protein
MASTATGKPLAEVGLYAHGQDSAVHLQDTPESSQPQAQAQAQAQPQPALPAPPLPHAAEETTSTTTTEEDEEDDDDNDDDDDDDDNDNDDDDENDDNDAPDDESDSAFDGGSLLEDETDTLASSILNHRMENGRQYHAYRDGAYWGPNDELAKEILDFAHHMYLLTLDQKLHLAPIENPQTILDVGTGTGIWAIVLLSLDSSVWETPSLTDNRTWQTNTPPLQSPALTYPQYSPNGCRQTVTLKSTM